MRQLSRAVQLNSSAESPSAHGFAVRMVSGTFGSALSSSVHETLRVSLANQNAKRSDDASGTSGREGRSVFV